MNTVKSGLTPQYILTKSLCRNAHCASEDTDRSRAMSEIEDMQWANEYAEPGYSNPVKGILFANWNYFSTDVTDILERAGYAIEWSDEWATCECGKAVRTSADSYGWAASYYMFDGYILCHECIADDPAEYLEEIEDNPRKAVSPRMNLDLVALGYNLIETDFENGFHPGQTDDPKSISARLAAVGHKGILFAIDGIGQFDVAFSVYSRIQL